MDSWIRGNLANMLSQGHPRKMGMLHSTGFLKSLSQFCMAVSVDWSAAALVAIALSKPSLSRLSFSRLGLTSHDVSAACWLLPFDFCLVG